MQRPGEISFDKSSQSGSGKDENPSTMLHPSGLVGVSHWTPPASTMAPVHPRLCFCPMFGRARGTVHVLEG